MEGRGRGGGLLTFLLWKGGGLFERGGLTEDLRYDLSVTFKGKQTITAQEQARDHYQSIKMKNRKHTYPFFFFNKTST